MNGLLVLHSLVVYLNDGVKFVHHTSLRWMSGWHLEVVFSFELRSFVLSCTEAPEISCDATCILFNSRYAVGSGVRASLRPNNLDVCLHRVKCV